MPYLKDNVLRYESVEYEVACEECGEVYITDINFKTFINADDARKEFKEQGWSYDEEDVSWYCPEHKESS